MPVLSSLPQARVLGTISTYSAALPFHTPQPVLWTHRLCHLDAICHWHRPCPGPWSEPWCSGFLSDPEGYGSGPPSEG